jgi:uncharacterized protein
LVRDLFASVSIADAVYEEIVGEGKGRPGASETQAAVDFGWLRRATVQRRDVVEALLADLHLGEAETIALAREQNADGVLMDDRTGRARAQMMGLHVTGTVGVLLLAREVGMAVDLQLDLDTLIQQGFRISPTLYQTLINRR